MALTTNKLIFIGWFITQIFYIYWFTQYNYIFGKSDIDNYMDMKNYTLTGYGLRHILIQTYITYLPMYMLVFLIPLIYWVGIVFPINILFGNNNLFCFVFGTASIGLFFIVGLWSQFLSMAFLMWALLFLRYKEYFLGIVSFILCLTYLPMIYYVILILLDISYGIILTIILMGAQKSMFNYVEWNIIYLLIFYICPVVWIKLLFFNEYSKIWTTELKCKFFICSLSRLSRGVIFMLPWLAISTTTKEKIIILSWWLFSNGWILYGFWLEAVGTDARYNRVFDYGFL